MAPRISASALQRIAACPASAALPQATKDGAAADRGHEIHGYLADLASGVDPAVALERVPAEHRAVCAEIKHPGSGLAEIAYALNVETGKARVLGQNIGRHYELKTNEIPGSADLVVVDAEAVHVTDYKTGRHEVAPPERNLQLGFLALAATRAHERTRATVGLRWIFEDGSHYDDRAGLDEFALADIATRLRKTYRAAFEAEAEVRHGRQPKVHEGEHCKFCPCRMSCPARVGMLQKLSAPAEVRAKFDALLPVDAKAAHAIVTQAQAVLNDLRSQLYAWAQENPIPLDDGRVFGPVEVSRDTINGRIALEVLREQHGDDVAMAAVELETSKAGIERALKNVAPAGKLAAMKRDALQAIAARGGIESKTTTQLKEHWPKEA